MVNGLLDNAPLMREIARAAYRAGARRVEAQYVDRHFTRALIELGPEESLGQSMPWGLQMLKTLREEKGCYIQVSGDPEPQLLADLPGDRVGKAGPREFRSEWISMVGARAVNWTIVPAPTPAWAEQVFGRPDMDALWQVIEKAIRLDRPDPVAAWRDHLARLKRIATALNERRFDSLRYRGPGTDLLVGLFENARFVCELELEKCVLQRVLGLHAVAENAVHQPKQLSIEVSEQRLEARGSRCRRTGGSPEAPATSSTGCRCRPR